MGPFRNEKQLQFLPITRLAAGTLHAKEREELSGALDFWR